MARKGKDLKDGGRINGDMGITITLTVSHGLLFLIFLMITLNFFLNPLAIPSTQSTDNQLVTSVFRGTPSLSSALGAVSPFSTDVTDEYRRILDVKKPRKAKVLMGIVTADVFGEPRYRSAFRDLFVLHPKVCRLGEYVVGTKAFQDRCELIYTFVLGANVDPNGPTEIVNETFPILTPPDELHPQHSVDFNETDMTFLNIR